MADLVHAVLGQSLRPPFARHLQQALFSMGCFWGAEKKFWSLPGVCTTAVGYSAGLSLDPSYAEVCSGLSGHAEVVLVVFDPSRVGYQDLLAVFWEAHDPTQGMRQGNDVGSQYRSGIYTFDGEQRALAGVSRQVYQQSLIRSGLAAITTEIHPAGVFHYAEDYHQQYLHKNPGGYCGLGGTGIAFRCD